MIDLSECVKGDFLLGRQGALMRYVGYDSGWIEAFPYIIEYKWTKDNPSYKNPKGSRTKEGFVYSNESVRDITIDEDIVFVIDFEDLYSIRNKLEEYNLFKTNERVEIKPEYKQYFDDVMEAMIWQINGYRLLGDLDNEVPLTKYEIVILNFCLSYFQNVLNPRIS